MLLGDYYSVAWCTFIRYYREKHAITSEAKSIYLINVLFIFTMQAILLIGVYYQLTRENAVESGSISMSMMHTDVVFTRLVCAFLMHMQSEPEVR